MRQQTIKVSFAADFLIRIIRAAIHQKHEILSKRGIHTFYRSDTINGKIFEMPKYKSFKPIISFILGLPIGEIAQESYNLNLTPRSDKEYYERQLNKKIEIEKIEALFELNNLGSPRSAEEKKIKASIILKIFGTTSKTEIEIMDYKLLAHLREELKT